MHRSTLPQIYCARKALPMFDLSPPQAGARGITDLKGKRVGLASSPPALLIMMAASVGLDRKDIDWVTDPKLRPLDLFADGKIDAFLGFPPEPQELRARHAGRVIVNTALDRPWSQYF